MEPGRSSVIPIQHKLNQTTSSVSSETTGKSIWNDMQSWVDERQREWDTEMTKLKNEFFTLKTSSSSDHNPTLTSRRSSSEASLPEKMSTSSRYCESGRGSRMFRLTFDISQFQPEEIVVRTQANSLIVHAKHQEKSENKSVSREFNRRVDIPPEIDPHSLQCYIGEDGTLQVEAELPSPSYDCSSLTRDSPSQMDNSSSHSIFSDRLSERDTSSPLRTDLYIPSRLDYGIYSSQRRQNDLYCNSPPGTDRGIIYSRPLIDRSTYSPPRLTSRDICSPPITTDRSTDNRDTFNSSTAEYDIYSSARTDSWQGTNANKFRPSSSKTDNYQRPHTNVLNQTHFGQNEYNEGLKGYQWLGHGVSDLSHEGFQRPNANSDRRNNSGFNSDPIDFSSLAPRAGDLEKRVSAENGHVTMDETVQDPDVFSVVINLGQEFEPQDLNVKTVDRKLVIYAQDPSRHFGQTSTTGDIYREFDLPQGVAPESITANLTSEGILIIEAPRFSRSSLLYTS